MTTGNVQRMREKLAYLYRRKEELITEAKGLARDIVPMINPLLLEIADMDIASAHARMSDLMMKQIELTAISDEIMDLEVELG